jgi:ribosomal protein S18 acetylase RimI-like enzyme
VATITDIEASPEISRFACGNSEIDRFFRLKALQEQKRRSVRVFVLRDGHKGEILGFYSLCVATLKEKSFPGFGRRPIPALYLAMIGVDISHKGRGIGRALMADAFKRAVLVAQNAGAFCLFLDAVDVSTARFYQNLGFETLISGELTYYIAIETLISVVADLP